MEKDRLYLKDGDEVSRYEWKAFEWNGEAFVEIAQNVADDGEFWFEGLEVQFDENEKPYVEE